MASSDESDSEAIETEIEYGLYKVEGSPHSSDQDDPCQSKTEEVYADAPLADEECLAHYKEQMKMECKLEKKPIKWLRGTHDQKVYRQTNLHTFDEEAGSP